MDYTKKSTTEEIKDRFDNDVERFSYLDIGQQATVDAPLSMELITRAAAETTPHAKKILDIGCGAGNNTIKLLQKINPLECHLLDLSLPMLNRAKERIKEINNGEVSIYHGDFRHIDLQQESYDIILAAAVLHHLRDDKDWNMAFEKIYSLLKPGGSLWISDLVSHDNQVVDNIMKDGYGKYLNRLGGEAFKQKVFKVIDKEDSPRSLTYQIKILHKVGFSSVDILHKNTCFAAFGAIK